MRFGAVAASVLCVALGVGVAALAVSLDAEISASSDHTVPLRKPLRAHPTRFALQPLGNVPAPFLTWQARLVTERFDADVEILPPKPLPRAALDRERHQYVATLLLDDLYIHKDPRFALVVGVTQADLYAEGWDYLYGFSQRDGGVAVISLSRLLSADARGLGWLKAGIERGEKVLLHEVGHVFDLDHCPGRRCVMRAADEQPGLEHLGRRFCSRCAHRVRVPRLPEAPEGPARADRLFRRGAFTRAWFRYVTEALQRPTHPEGLNRVGLAAAAAGSPRVAELSYRLAIRLDPTGPLPYYNYGLLMAYVDPERAAALLQRGLTRDPDRVEALGFLATVYLEVLGNEHRALWYFQRYAAEGGANPDVLFRYHQLLQPAVYEFTTREVPAIRAQPEDAASPLLSGVQEVELALETAAWSEIFARVASRAAAWLASRPRPPR